MTSATETAAQKVGPAVVTVQVSTVSTTRFGGSVQGTATGSGVIVDAREYIVTNNHVVEGARSIQVILADGQTYTAQLVGTTPFHDLAVIKITPTAALTVAHTHSRRSCDIRM